MLSKLLSSKSIGNLLSEKNKTAIECSDLASSLYWNRIDIISALWKFCEFIDPQQIEVNNVVLLLCSATCLHTGPVRYSRKKNGHLIKKLFIVWSMFKKVLTLPKTIILIDISFYLSSSHPTNIFHMCRVVWVIRKSMWWLVLRHCY